MKLEEPDPREADLRTAPDLASAQEAQDARRTLNSVLLATMAACLGLLAVQRFTRDSISLVIAVVILVAALLLNRWSKAEHSATLAFVLLLCLAGEAGFRAKDGVRSVTALMFPTLLLLAALVMRLRWFVAYAIAILLVVAAIGWHDILRFTGGQVPSRTPTSARTVFVIELILALGATAAGLLVHNLQRGLRRTRESSARLQQAKQKLEESESMFRTLIDLAADAILIADPQGAILRANQKACALTGFSLDELRDRSIVRLFEAEPGSAGPPSIERFSEESQGPFNALIACHDGSTRPVELNSKLMPGHVIQIICRDISDRLQAEQRIFQLQKLESIGLLAGGVAHDFNNLLTVINGFALLALARLDPNDPLRGQIEQIHKAGVRGANLTAQLLAFGRKQLIRPEPVRMNRLIVENQEILARLMGEDITLSTSLAPDAGLILADPGLFHQVLINLAANARDAMPGGGRLTIATENVERPQIGKCVRLSVSDTGTGMTEEVRRRIFEPFFTTKEEGRGTGLGLATVYGIVQQIGGTVTVESEPGAGTTFQFLFPRIEAEEPASSGLDCPTADPQGGETILMVEDNPGVRSYTREVLEGQGYRILEAEDARAALEHVAALTGPLHLLLTDVVLPGVNGRDLAGRVLQLLPQVQVLFMSGYAEDRLEAFTTPQDGSAYLAKPFTPDELTAKVREVLNSRA